MRLFQEKFRRTTRENGGRAGGGISGPPATQLQGVWGSGAHPSVVRVSPRGGVPGRHREAYERAVGAGWGGEGGKVTRRRRVRAWGFVCIAALRGPEPLLSRLLLPVLPWCPNPWGFGWVAFERVHVGVRSPNCCMNALGLALNRFCFSCFGAVTTNDSAHVLLAR